MLQQIYPSRPHKYRYELNKDMQFAAAHFVPDEEAGPCANVHGHTYFVNLTIAGNQLDEIGFLVDFHKLKNLVHGRYDHKLLNDLPDFTGMFDRQVGYKFPTTEVVARTIWETVQNHLDELPHKPVCVQVFLRETPTSYVVFRPDDIDDDSLMMTGHASIT